MNEEQVFDCKMFGRELPTDWQCVPDCPLAEDCYRAYEAQLDKIFIELDQGEFEPEVEVIW